MYLLSLWDCPAVGWPPLTHAALQISATTDWLKHAVAAWSLRNTSRASLVSFFNFHLLLLLLPSLSLFCPLFLSVCLFFNSTENHNVRCWRPPSHPDAHWWCTSCQRQQRGAALQTARYDLTTCDKYVLHHLLKKKKEKKIRFLLGWIKTWIYSKWIILPPIFFFIYKVAHFRIVTILRCNHNVTVIEIISRNIEYTVVEKGFRAPLIFHSINPFLISCVFQKILGHKGQTPGWMEMEIISLSIVNKTKKIIRHKKTKSILVVLILLSMLVTSLK